MDTQTPNDYKQYFSNKFTNLFQLFVNECHDKVIDDTIKTNLGKIVELYNKLNYDKIVDKICSNNVLQEKMLYVSKNNFTDDILNETFKSVDSKTCMLMPSLYIDKIFKNVSIDCRMDMYNKFHSLYICAVTYNKVNESLKKSNTNDTNNTNTFNPFESVGQVAENLDINTLFDGVEVKTLSGYEMIMEQLINKQMEGKIMDHMSNIKEDEVNEAAEKLNDVLNSDNFKGKEKTTVTLKEMLGQIKNAVNNLKHQPVEKTKGKQGIEQLLGIAQQVAGNMMSSIKENNIDVLDLWDTTSSLAKSTTNSDALNLVDKLIRTNIENNLKQKAVQEQNLLNTSTQNTDTTDNNANTDNQTQHTTNSKYTSKYSKKGKNT